MSRKESIIISILFIISIILVTFFLNTATLIISLVIIVGTAIYDSYKKPTLGRILFYIIVFAAFSVYIIFFI
ncbi:hypothetical protein NP439_04390 [Oceanobacillus jeddahense]|uniref:DUF3953 domain-containing protein n=1 Tax=Oceanobacillus jeddahense TaxID=1462527 RepID=A0ABY5JVX2_9BACI|nr:hypothetical protein [Oceanobacillus jeddahense]UUI03940.1 hypothetical protein NP439_04390 [Oceanobacillus jeddahense]